MKILLNTRTNIEMRNSVNLNRPKNAIKNKLKFMKRPQIKA